MARGLEFEWDPAKAEENFRNHKVRFEEATLAFDDPAPIVVCDAESSFEEERWILIGSHHGKKPLFIVYTHRRKHGRDVIRLISAREADRAQREFYEEERFKKYFR